MEILIMIGSIVGLLIVIGISIYPAFKVIPFAYGSSRIRAARSKIISDEELTSLINKPYKDIIYYLEKNGFSEILNLINTDFKEEFVQQVIKKNSQTNINRIIHFVPDKYKPFFKVLQSKHEYDLILTVLRSKINPYYKRHIIQSLYSETKFFNAKDLEELESISIDDFLLKLKKTPYYKIISEFSQEIKNHELNNLEKAMDEHYFAMLRNASKIDPALIKYTKILIDRHNIKEALCFSKRNFIKGGTFSESVLSKLNNSKKIEEVISILEHTGFSNFIKDSKDTKSIIQGMYKCTKDFSKKLMLKDPLSINPFVAYYIQKELELKNIRIILKLVHARFPADDIRGALI